MRFALLGNHADGLALAHALVKTGRHELVAAEGTAPPFAPDATIRNDLEDLLAEPQIDLVIVAGSVNVRAEQLRRALQSEHDVACVHPLGNKPDAAYEAALIQGDTKRSLYPILPQRFHPAFLRLMELIRNDGQLRLIEWQRHTKVAETGDPPWDILRLLGGDIVEVSALSRIEHIEPGQPVAFAGRYEKLGLIHGLLLPTASEEFERWIVHGANIFISVIGPDAEGRTFLRRRDSEGLWHDESWQQIDLFTAFVDNLEKSPDKLADWSDAIRVLELNDALKRSIEKRRTSGLEYQEISEEVGNKGTLTLIGCGLIWIMLLIFGLSVWFPMIRWAVVPLLVGYLLLLALNWAAKK